MRICPKCRVQFGSNITKCFSCNVLLLSVVQGGAGEFGALDDGSGLETGETGGPAQEKLLLIHEEPLPEMAAMIKEFLHNSGIDCIVHGESIGLLYRLPVPGAPISRSRLYVRESDYHEARELVTNFFKKI